jgi:hypothetical protein
VPAVLTAFLVGGLVGLAARPFVDAYVRWRTIQFYASAPRHEDLERSDEHLSGPIV